VVVRRPQAAAPERLAQLARLAQLERRDAAVSSRSRQGPRRLRRRIPTAS
jgi:hypothetical protein